MNEPSRLTDRELTDMLRRRSARPAPEALASAVLESLASERARHPARTAGRSAKRPMVLLAAAALLLVGGAMAAGSGLVKLPSPVPPVPAPSLAVVATASSAPPTGLVAYSVVDCPATLLPGGCPSRNHVTHAWLAAADGRDAHMIQGTSIVGWSADGSRLVVQNPNAVGGAVSLLVDDPTGAVVATIDVPCTYPPTDNSVIDGKISDIGHLCPDGQGEYALSPDGTRVAFTRTDPNVDNASVISIVDLATGQSTVLTATRTTNPPTACNTSTAARTCQGFDANPRWSPDGRTIAFERYWMAPEPGASWDSAALFVVDADGSNLRRVTPSSVYASNPAWSPDGTRLAFEADVPVLNAAGTSVLKFKSDVYTIGVDGSELARLTDDGISIFPDWTSGGRLAFIHHVADLKNENWIIDADGGNQSRLGGSLADLTAAGCTTCLYVPRESDFRRPLPRAYWQPVP
jgi:hypothetical protein